MHNNLKERSIVHLAEGSFSLRHAKMSTGVIRYSNQKSVAVIDSTQAGKTVEEVTGIKSEIPVPIVASIEDAFQYNPNTLLIGITPTGGKIPQAWRQVIESAMDHGMDIISGMHEFLSNDPVYLEKSKQANIEIWDLRKPSPTIPVGGGLCRWAKSYICLTVGTDCAIGKMTVALEIQKEAIEQNLTTEFIPTGQTGIAIAGWGSPIDAIAGDFMAGAVEQDILSRDDADLILVEGQGALLHPGYSSVTLALLHGSCPDSLVLCHRIDRKEISKIRDIPIPSFRETIENYLVLAKPIKPTKIVAFAVNTAGHPEEEVLDYLKKVEDELQVPATDPVRYGSSEIVKAIKKHKLEIGK